MPVQTGLDRLIEQNFTALGGQAVALLCNQASISSDLRHVIEILMPAHRAGQLKIQAIFGPQHGLFGHTQDNMIEWEGAADSRTGIAIHSLYGENREPTPEMLAGVERLVVDLQDVGARYYTFIWTMALSMKACEKLGIPVTVLDRPNPIGGTQIEGPVLDPEFASFVGLFPLPIRHGMTIGEIATHLQRTQFPRLDLDVVWMEGWNRSTYFEDTGLPWAMPSPNMPTPDTAIVYPGGCLLEGTNISEGRGTTRPFEMFGAPFVDASSLCHALNSGRVPGAYFRPIEFEPTFHKFARELCHGAFVHVVDRQLFEPVHCYIAILAEIRHQCGQQLQWRDGPYEYEHQKRPIDILFGNSWTAESIDRGEALSEIQVRADQETNTFRQVQFAHPGYGGS